MKQESRQIIYEIQNLVNSTLESSGRYMILHFGTTDLISPEIFTFLEMSIGPIVKDISIFRTPDGTPTSFAAVFLTDPISSKERILLSKRKFKSFPVEVRIFSNLNAFQNYMETYSENDLQLFENHDHHAFVHVFHYQGDNIQFSQLFPKQDSLISFNQITFLGENTYIFRIKKIEDAKNLQLRFNKTIINNRKITVGIVYTSNISDYIYVKGQIPDFVNSIPEIEKIIQVQDGFLIYLPNPAISAILYSFLKYDECPNLENITYIDKTLFQQKSTESEPQMN